MHSECVKHSVCSNVNRHFRSVSEQIRIIAQCILFSNSRSYEMKLFAWKTWSRWRKFCIQLPGLENTRWGIVSSFLGRREVYGKSFCYLNASVITRTISAESRCRKLFLKMHYKLSLYTAGPNAGQCLPGTTLRPTDLNVYNDWWYFYNFAPFCSLCSFRVYGFCMVLRTLANLTFITLVVQLPKKLWKHMGFCLVRYPVLNYHLSWLCIKVINAGVSDWESNKLVAWIKSGFFSSQCFLSHL